MDTKTPVPVMHSQTFLLKVDTTTNLGYGTCLGVALKDRSMDFGFSEFSDVVVGTVVGNLLAAPDIQPNKPMISLRKDKRDFHQRSDLAYRGPGISH